MLQGHATKIILSGGNHIYVVCEGFFYRSARHMFDVNSDSLSDNPRPADVPTRPINEWPSINLNEFAQLCFMKYVQIARPKLKASSSMDGFFLWSWPPSDAHATRLHL